MSAALVHFPPFCLDPSNERLWRETVEIPLRPKTFAVLRYLVEHPEQLVTKEELLNAVWAETVVGEDALTGCIRDLRKVLGDEAKHPQYIETVHRRGFRFIGEVVSSQHSVASREEDNQKPVLSVVEETNGREIEIETEIEKTPPPDTEQAEGLRFEASEPPQSSPSSLQPVASSLSQDSAPTPQHSLASRFSRGLILAAVLLIIVTALTVHYLSLPVPSTQSLTPNPQSLPLPDKPSIIVLPLVNLSNDPEQDYFSDGLTEALTGDLSRIYGLFVIARNSAFTYKGKAVKVQDVSKEMGVRYVLEGSVQKADQQIRITTQLIDATTGYHLWSQQYDRPLKDIFALQDEIVQKIVTTLKLHLSVREQGFLVRKTTDNLEAYDTYLRGLEYFPRFTKEANAQARQMFERAITLDPAYAEAYTMLGWTYGMEWIWQWSPDPQSLERAFELARQALALDDTRSGAHTLLSWVYRRKHQPEHALAAAEQAVALAPNHDFAYIQLSESFIDLDRSAEAVRAAEQALRLNPRYPSDHLVHLGRAYYLTGRYEEAIAAQQQALLRNPNFLVAYTSLVVNYTDAWLSQLRQDPRTPAQALEAAQRAVALYDSSSLAYLALSLASLMNKHYAQAEAAAERSLALNPGSAELYVSAASILNWVGRSAEALKLMEQALHLNPRLPSWYFVFLGQAYSLLGRTAEAVEPLQRVLSVYPHRVDTHLLLAAVYSELGQAAEARAEAAEVLRLNPKFSLEVHRQRTPIKDPAMLERHIVALRKAGLK